MSTPRGRYAPSPTGEMHLGNASSALLAWLSIRARNGTFVMRMEDLDRNRVRPGLAEGILRDLAWLGIDWDEGPDVGGANTPYDQWERRDLYRAALGRLIEAGRLYRCFCSRKDIAAAASAPQTPGEERRYPETCRMLDERTARERVAEGRRYAWRLRVGREERPSFRDLVHGVQDADSDPPGDFVVWRSDEVPAYQLAVVVDDIEMDIDEVVRGDDLITSTAKQLVLYDSLEQRPPAFGHVPLLLGPDGVRLSKRHQGVTLRELREQGATAEEIVGRLAHLLGLRPTPEPIAARDLVNAFALEAVRPAPDGLVVDPAAWSPTSGT